MQETEQGIPETAGPGEETKDSQSDEKRLFEAILLEYVRARRHGPIHSAHEGYAIMKEELDELWEEVRKRRPDQVQMAMECVQVAAVAIRFLVEVCRHPDVRTEAVSRSSS